MNAKCLIYSRVSTEKQNNDSSINDLKDYANYKKYEIVEVYEDTISGKSKGEDRTGFKQLLNYIQNNEIEHILIWELSRLGRNLLDVLTNINILTELQINVYSKKENLNTLNEDKTPNPNSSLLLGIMSTLGEYERSTIVERTRRGLRFAVKNGAAHAQPFGYKGNENKKMVINETEAKTVKLIFQMFLEGYSVFNIVRHLNQNNITTKTGKKWGDVIVRSLLRNPLYMGERNYNFGTVQIPAIISKSQYLKVQTIFKSNQNLNKDKIKVKHYLNDLIVCAECKTKYIQYSRNDKKTFFYKCMNNKLFNEGIRDEKCLNKPIHIDWLNSMVYYSLISNSMYLINSKKYKDYTTKVTSTTKKELTKTVKQIVIIENEIKTLTNKLNRLNDLLLNESLTEQEYLNLKDNINIQIEKQTKQLNEQLLNKEQLNNTINNSNNLKHFVSPETFEEHIKTFIQSIIVSKADIEEHENLKDLTKQIHYHRMRKIEVKTIFKTYTFYYVGGLKTIKAVQLIGNRLQPIKLIEGIVLGMKTKKFNYYETLKPII